MITWRRRKIYGRHLVDPKLIAVPRYENGRLQRFHLSQGREQGGRRAAAGLRHFTDVHLDLRSGREVHRRLRYKHPAVEMCTQCDMNEFYRERSTRGGTA